MPESRKHSIGPTFFVLAICFAAWVILFGKHQPSLPLTAQVTGQTYYVCDCVSDASGSPAAGCVAGVDTNTGTSPQTPWKTVTKASAKFNGSSGLSPLQPGEAIAFCRGGAFAAATLGGRNKFCTPENPCTLQDYTAPWAAGNEERPLLRGGTSYGISFVGSNDASTRTRGVTIKNLWLKGAMLPQQYGVFLMNGVDDILLENLLIEGFEIAVYPANNTFINPSFPMSRNVTLRDSTIRDNGKMGFLGQATNLLIQDNVFDNNGWMNSDNGYPAAGQNRALHHHNIYVSWNAPGGGTEPLSGIRIIGNTSTRSALMSDGKCGGIPIVLHGGMIKDILIEGNTITDAPGKVGEGCWPIALTPYGYSYGGFENVIIRNNILPNIAGAGILVKSCAHCLIEGNSLIHSDTSFDVSPISVLGETVANDAPTTDVDVRYNSMILSRPNSIFQGINFSKAKGTGHSIVGNAILALNSPYKDWRCLHIGDLPLTAFDAIDRNVCLGTGLTKWAQAGATSYSLAQWQQFSSFDQFSQALDPLFTSLTNLLPKTGSPLIDAGGTDCPSTDVTGKNRPQGNACDIGAYEVGTGGASSATSSANSSVGTLPPLCVTVSAARTGFLARQAVLTLLQGTQTVVPPQTVTVDQTTQKACLPSTALTSLNPNQSYTLSIRPLFFVTTTITVPNLNSSSPYPVTGILVGDFNDDGQIDLSDLLKFVSFIKNNDDTNFSQISSSAAFSDLFRAIIDAIRQYKDG